MHEHAHPLYNIGIDSPLGDIPEEARPMWSWIVSDENYRKEYHDTLSQLANIIENDAFKNEVYRIFELIMPYVEKEPKPFFIKEAFQKAKDTLVTFVELRAESVRKQLTNELAARSEDQDRKDRINASQITVTVMGTIPESK